jgi:hypothetical protein
VLVKTDPGKRNKYARVCVKSDHRGLGLMGEKEPFPRCSQSNTRKKLKTLLLPSSYALENFVQLGQAMCTALQGEQHRGVLAASGCPASKVHGHPLLLQCLHSGNKVRTTAPVGWNPSDGNDRGC